MACAGLENDAGSRRSVDHDVKLPRAEPLALFVEYVPNPLSSVPWIRIIHAASVDVSGRYARIS